MGILQAWLTWIVLTMKVLLICNYRPGVGGISGQVELLQMHLCAEGHAAEIFSTKGTLLWRLGMLGRLWREAKHYDVLHVHCCSGWGFMPATVGITIGRHLKKRTVLTYHGGGGERFFDRYPRLVRHYLTRTDANIVLSWFLAKVFDKHDLPYAVIPNIIELDEQSFRRRERLRPHFICTRAHEPLYNIPCILRAFRLVQVKHPEAALTLVGDGSQHAVLVAMARDMNLRNVIFTGRVDNSEIYRQLDKADILLSAPRVDNMPVSLLEAMNAGLLVISSRVGGVPYMIEDGVTGLLFESDNADQLAERMLWAITHQPYDIVANAHAQVYKYRWEYIKKQLYTAYGIPA